MTLYYVSLRRALGGVERVSAVSSRTKNLDLTRIHSSRFLILRGGIPRSKGNFPEIQTQRFLVCGFLVFGFTVAASL